MDNMKERLAEISDQFSRGDWDSILENHLNAGKEMSLANNYEKRSILCYLLAACMQRGYYCDYLEVLEKYYNIDPDAFLHDKADMLKVILNYALESLLYCLYNNEDENLGIKYNISERIDQVLCFQDKLSKGVEECQNQHLCELKDLYEDYKNGRMPIYVVEYLYPFEPIIKDYVFDLSQCPPYISVEIKKVPRDKDNYTSFKIKAKGLIKPDTLWMGPRWECREKMPPIKKTLSIVNMILLYAVKASPGKMVLPYSIEQVSTATMFQYRHDEHEPILGGTITYTDFSAQFVGENSRWHEFTDDELLQLNKFIVNIFSSKPFVTTFHHATNLLSGGFYLESFLLLCSSCEGMAYHWCEEIAKQCGLGKEYREFSQTKISKCDSCELFLHSDTNKPYLGMEPSLFDNFTFLEKQKCITTKEAKHLKKYLSKVRNNNLRNQITHGANNVVTQEEVKKSLDALFKLQESFEKITARIRETQKSD